MPRRSRARTAFVFGMLGSRPFDTRTTIVEVARCTMSRHTARIAWRFSGGEFFKGRYSREHTWTFDGGVTVPASPSPAVVAAPYSNAANVDPEEAFVAAIASCHMLTFLFLASRAKFDVLRYEDDAVGRMEKNEKGVPWVSAVTLNPTIEYGARRPSAEEEANLHHRAHEECFISNSVKTRISVNQAPSPSLES
jgi:organic hydroperoxide reductase OsmC/OhrA